MLLNNYIDALQKVSPNKKGGHESPRKPALLLAVIDLLVFFTENSLHREIQKQGS